MKHLEHIGNHFKGIARDPKILLDFPRGCQRCPKSHNKDPQGKGRKEEKEIVCIYIYYIHIASLRVEGVQGKKKTSFFFFRPPPLLALLYIAPP